MAERSSGCGGARLRGAALCAAALAGALGLGACWGPVAEDGGVAAEAGRAAFDDVRERAFEPPPEPAAPAKEDAEPAPFAPSSADLLALSGQREPFAFAAAEDDEAPTLSQEALDALEAAAQTIVDQGAEVGYLLLNLESGRGVAADVDARVFSASSIKAPYAQFLCETQLDVGGIDPGEEADVRALMEAAVSESDNDSYHALRDRFAGPAFGAWLDSLGIGEEFSREQHTPYYTARESALLWLRMSDYLGGGAPSARWLEGLLENARVSFMRHAIARDDVRVLSKAGWLDGEGDEDGFCDSGLVIEDGCPYLLAVMTSLPYSPEAEYPFEALVQAVWSARADLSA